MFPETENVPVERLLNNLTRELKAGTNDLEVTYQIARVHSMIYATNAQNLAVAKRTARISFGWPVSDAGVPETVKLPADADGLRRAAKHLAAAIEYYEKALKLLRETDERKARRWILPIHLGYAWCLDQAGRRGDALKAYRQTLDIAWQTEVIGEFNFKQWLSQRWDDLKAMRNPLKGQRRGSIGPGVCYSSEVIRYLLKLLDPEKDKSEIADLKDRQKELNSMPRAITPIVVPVTEKTNLTELIDPQAAVRFDLDGTGELKRWGWITTNAAWLVYDHDGSGNIGSGLQMMGAVTFWIFWENGYQPLAALDNNGDGRLEGAELNGLSLWRDANQNGISDPGEVRPVGAWGVVTISTDAISDTRGMQWNSLGVQFRRGGWRPTYDWIAHSIPEPSIQ
ncbi:hypothetical protein GC207_00345 [bacterium]|nr:hypothetical protein [bacterium]